jgi:hypothetical protein
VNLRLTALALAAAILTPSAAAARNVVIPVPIAQPGGFLQLVGPRLAGSSIVWAEQNSRGGIDVRRAGSTGTVRPVASLPRPGRLVALVLEASPRRVGLSELACGPDCSREITADRVLEGPLAGPLAHVIGCSPDSIPCGNAMNCVVPPAVDVWEHAVAIGSTCGTPSFVRDHSGGSGYTDTTLPGVEGARIAGRYLIWRESLPSGKSDLVVYDRTAGHEAYRIAAPFADVDIQEDGKVAFTIPEPGESGRARIAWASLDEPVAHVVGTARGYPSLLIASDRIAVRDGPAASRQPLKVLTLSGQVQARALDEAPIGSFDFDGARLAWASQPCADAHVLAWDLSQPRPPAAPRGACPAAMVDQARLAIRTDRRTALWMRCAPRGALGCMGKLRLLADAGTARYLIASVSYHVHPGKRARLSLRLTPEAARFVARHRGARVRATSIAVSRAGRGLSGTFEVRSRTLTLSR